MIVPVGSTITAIAQVAVGDIIFNTGLVPVYVDTVQANVLQAPRSTATPVAPGASVQWAGQPGLLYAIDPTGSKPGIGVTSHTGLPFPAPVGGSAVVVNSLGFFLYSSNPAGLGKLIFSDTIQGVFSDGLGNATLIGATQYFNNLPGMIAVQINDGAVAFSTAPGPGGPYTEVGQVQGTTNFTTLSSNNGDAGLASTGGSITAKAFPGGLQGQVAGAGITLGFQGQLVLSETDSSAPVANTVAVTALTKVWQIPTTDMQIGTVYRFTASAKGAQGTSTNASSWGIKMGAGNIIAGSNSAAFWGASQGIFVKVLCEIEIVALGVGGSVRVSLTELMENQANFTDNSPTSSGGGTVAVDLSAASVSLEFDWQWASVTGGPSITGQGSILERIGA